ncbi:RING-type E3 ubiquitin transferase [Caenorhabditis elegans]|uniref:RING-type E3 ubiquitin transferase n=1 Tax=Caenorhabditis elegans TaxID=6239 RepID=A0A5K1ICF1_CAEEL|nr:RING-type E3 ubiquitin transferase [Caenorhabditis elegans]VWL58506.1 RING-type E3 ubiquitin transferase [Caenorhabditis elegans]
MPDEAVDGSTPDQGKKNNNGRGRGQGSGGNRGRGGSTANNNASRRPNPARQNQSSRQPTKVDMKKYERMISAAHTNFSDIPCGQKSIDCDICCKKNDVFGIGSCRHPVCAECVIRMRILGNSKTCPVCRSDIDILSFCTTDDDLANVPLSFKKTAHPDEDRYDIRFSNKIAGTKYEKYLAHVCKICKTDDGERLEFPSFMSLRQHMASRHEQSYCHICTDNLNLFSRERKTYTRDQLQRHMRSGDFDDKSFKGHPQCLFCEQKFLDEENRYRHLRKDHFFCQFCESDGTMTNVFFGKHDGLKKHYKEHHYICETEECREMGIAFANKFELDLHRANEHAERRNLIELGFGQRPSDPGRPIGSFRGRGLRSNEPPPPPVPRERIAVVQRQVETNPQSDPSQFTTVRSAQSKGVFTSTRSAYTSNQQEFPSLAPQAPPPNVRSSEFPRLNKANKPAAPAAPAVVDHFPSLGDSSSSSSAPPLRIKVPPLVKKRQPPPPAPAPQKAKASSARQNAPREEDDEYISRRDVPQAVVKVNNSLLRFDTVDDRVIPQNAKSNIQMIQRVDQKSAAESSSSAPSSGRLDFPALPAASAPMMPANSSWLNSKNSKIKSGVISSVSVPANYSKATQNKNKKKNKISVPKTEVWSSLGPPPDSAVASVPVETWQDIPLSKEAQLEKEKRERKEDWARKKAEIQARVAAASKDKSNEVDSDSEPEPARPITPPVHHSNIEKSESSEWTMANSKSGDSLKNAQLMANQKKNKKNKNNMEIPSANKVPSSQSSIVPSAPKVDSLIVEKVVAKTEPKNDENQDKPDLWNMPKLPSMTSMFSSFSLSGMFGMGTSYSDSSSMAAPPPGLENVVLTPPPGLGFPSPKSDDISFASAPILSHDDVKAKRERLEAEKQKNQKEAEKEDDGWVTTSKPKNNKKNNKK